MCYEQNSGTQAVGWLGLVHPGNITTSGHDNIIADVRNLNVTTLGCLHWRHACNDTTSFACCYVYVIMLCVQGKLALTDVLTKFWRGRILKIAFSPWKCPNDFDSRFAGEIWKRNSHFRQKCFCASLKVRVNRQGCRVVMALNLKSGDRGSKSRSATSWCFC